MRSPTTVNKGMKAVQGLTNDDLGGLFSLTDVKTRDSTHNVLAGEGEERTSNFKNKHNQTTMQSPAKS